MTTDTAARRRRTSGAGARNAGVEPLAEADMRPLPRVGSDRAAETLAGIGAEIARFGTARLHVAMEAQKELAGCRSAGEMREVHARYVQRAMTDYAAEWLRLWEIGLSVAARPFDARPVPLPKRHATPV